MNIIDANEKTLTDFLRNTVGFVFQFYNLIGDLTARENVALSAGLSRNPMDVDEALSLVGLSERADILLCDEPTGALDSKKRPSNSYTIRKDMQKTRPNNCNCNPFYSNCFHGRSNYPHGQQKNIEEIVNLSIIKADQIEY